MPKSHKVREVRKILRKFDNEFQFWYRRGKGSEQIIYHPNVNGKPASFPFKCHGEGTELSKGVITGIIRRFNLPKDLFS